MLASAIAVGAFAFAAGATPPQSRSPETPIPTAQIQSSSDLVRIAVSVLDSSGNFVAGLRQEDFRVIDNGVEQPIAFFLPTEAPAQILLMLEAGPSVYLVHETHLHAAYALLDSLSVDDEVGIVAYSKAPRIVLPFTTNKFAAAAALGGIEYGLGSAELNFYDSVSEVLDWLDPREGKLAIVLLTTGLDSSSPMHWSALAEKARTKNVVIFAVALGGSLRTAAEQEPQGHATKKKKHAKEPADGDLGPSAADEAAVAFATADRSLKSLASITGGRAYFPQSEGDFPAIYRQIGAALRHEYVLGITPRRDGAVHSITVQVMNQVQGPGTPADGAAGSRAGYQVLARQGYLAPPR